ncbi:MAG TPA: FliH/SctL family protein [Solirubrobacteraceae bacterium]|nr:FliH/SctL family protein [Solirubrobacteraceae bacterium]
MSAAPVRSGVPARGASPRDGQESAAATVEAYTFRQLEAPAGTVGRAADLLSVAHAEAEEIRARARAEGEAQGRAAGEAAIRAELQGALRAAGEAAQALSRLGDAVVAELERDAVELGLRLAEQIVAGALSVQRERLVEISAQALRRISERRRVTLVCNPADLDLLSESVQALRSQLGGIEQLSVQADRRVGRGGVIARTEDGEIDATIEAQLSRAREVVAAQLGGRPSAAVGPDGVKLGCNGVELGSDAVEAGPDCVEAGPDGAELGPGGAASSPGVAGAHA